MVEFVFKVWLPGWLSSPRLGHMIPVGLVSSSVDGQRLIGAWAVGKFFSLPGAVAECQSGTSLSCLSVHEERGLGLMDNTTREQYCETCAHFGINTV